jgi:hypothetical protein
MPYELRINAQCSMLNAQCSISNKKTQLEQSELKFQDKRQTTSCPDSWFLIPVSSKTNCLVSKKSHSWVHAEGAEFCAENAERYDYLFTF